LKKQDLDWIDDFMKRVKSHLFVREEDSVLILPPNRVYKLNTSGLALVRFCKSGGRIGDIGEIEDEERILEVHNFFCDLKAFYSGCPELPDSRRAVESIPYGFDFTILPILGEIAVTYKCNNKCAFCYARCKPDNSAKELSTDDIKRIIDVFVTRAKIPFFSFTGGEPLIREDIDQLIWYATNRKIQVNLITNGTLATKKRVAELAASGLKTVQISIEGPDESIHDALTQTDGSFVKTLEGIANFRKKGISVQTNTTVNRLNLKVIDRLPEFLASIGISRFSMNLFIPCGTGLDNTHLFLPYSEIPEVIESVRKKAERLGLVFYWYSPVPHCYYNPIAMGMGNKSCAAMDGLLSVSPGGEVLPCSSYPESMGNILKDDFSEIWFSKRASFFKKKNFAPEECVACSMFTACQSACPLYWAFAGTDEIRAKKCTDNRTDRM